MAHKTMQLTEAGVQSYRTRMLVGEPITVSGADAKLLKRLGWAEERKPRKAAAPIIPTVEEVLTAEVVEAPAAPAKPAATRKTLSAKK